MFGIVSHYREGAKLRILVDTPLGSFEISGGDLARFLESGTRLLADELQPGERLPKSEPKPVKEG